MNLVVKGGQLEKGHSRVSQQRVLPSLPQSLSFASRFLFPFWMQISLSC